MAQLADLQGHKIGLDPVVFIYALEDHPTFGDRATQLFEQIEQGASLKTESPDFTPQGMDVDNEKNSCGSN